MPDNQEWTKYDVVERIERLLGKPTEKLWKAKKSTLIDILHYMERGKIDPICLPNSGCAGLNIEG